MKVATVVGARPQFIKCAPLSRKLRETAAEVLIHTGQHYDSNMSELFFRDLEIPQPDYNLGVGSGTHGEQSGEMLKQIEKVLLKEKPDYTIVFGDTNSTLAGALAAAKLCIPVAHVEAGLRSFNRRMAEEINRVVTDHLSSLLFCPTETSVSNLAREGITERVYLVGDVMYDALLSNARRAEEKSRILEQLQLRPKCYFLATVHRAENTDDPSRLEAIVKAFELISDIFTVVWPVHPRTRKVLESSGLRKNGQSFSILDPVSYLDMLCLEKHARGILTDSGGVQKEAYWLQVPCITLRQESEWVETLQSGWNTLVGTDPETIFAAATKLAAIGCLFEPSIRRRSHGRKNRSGATRSLSTVLLRNTVSGKAALVKLTRLLKTVFRRLLKKTSEARRALQRAESRALRARTLCASRLAPCLSVRWGFNDWNSLNDSNDLNFFKSQPASDISTEHTCPDYWSY